jgi:hypothetical protein
MAAKFGVDKGKPIYVPMLPGESFSNDQSPVHSDSIRADEERPYAEAIGHVLWPVMISRPDALCAVGILAQFVQNPGWAHWKALKRVIGYLYATRDLWLTFGGVNATLKGSRTLIGRHNPIVARSRDMPSKLGRVSSLGAQRSSRSWRCRVPNRSTLLRRTRRKSYVAPCVFG